MAEKGLGYRQIVGLVTAQSVCKGVSILYGPQVVAAGGTGYKVGDIVTLVGGTTMGAFAARLVVTAVDALGGVTGITVNRDGLDGGAYTAKPGNPASLSGGSGAGCTLTLAWVDDVPPAGCTHCYVQGETQNVRYRSDGIAPTASVGNLLLTKAPGVEDIELLGGDMRRTQFIQVTATATLDVEFYRS